MSVERRKDGSITIKNNNGVTVVGRIIGAYDSKREERFQGWVDECAKCVTAGTHTFKETEQYFLEHCEALPLNIDDRRMRNFQCNVMMNFLKDKMKHQAPAFSFDMADHEIEEWHKEQDAMHEEALNSPPERFGLIMRGYYLPHTERNEAYYEQAHQNWVKHVKLSQAQNTQAIYQDICFFFEETMEYVQSTGGGDSLMQQIIIFRGISEEDIKERSPRFLGYISTLREMGELLDFTEK